MINSIENFAGGYYAVTTKQTYIDKFDKSLKLPFISVMQNRISGIGLNQSGEQKADNSDYSVLDNVELSSAVTGISPKGDPGTGNATYAR